MCNGSGDNIHNINLPTLHKIILKTLIHISVYCIALYFVVLKLLLMEVCVHSCSWWLVWCFADMRRDVQEIFRMTPHEKQVMMFSATLSKDIRPICKKFMQDVIVPLHIPPSFHCGSAPWWLAWEYYHACGGWQKLAGWTAGSFSLPHLAFCLRVLFLLWHIRLCIFTGQSHLLPVFVTVSKPEHSHNHE